MDALEQDSTPLAVQTKIVELIIDNVLVPMIVRGHAELDWVRISCQPHADLGQSIDRYVEFSADFNRRGLARIHPQREKSRLPSCPTQSISVLDQANQWRDLMTQEGLKNYAELATFLCRTRARVVQVMSVLQATPLIIDALQAANKRGIIVTERRWRFLRSLQSDTVLKALSTLKPGLY